MSQKHETKDSLGETLGQVISLLEKHQLVENLVQKQEMPKHERVESLVPNQTDTYYNLALAHYKMSNSRLADIYFNRYQDMLSLRKAQQRLVEVRKEQERDAKINATEAKPKILKKRSTLKKKDPSLKTKSDTGKLTIPGWE